MTEIVNIPETLPLNPFPHVDALEESYNADAYEVGLQLPPAIERAREIVEAGRVNAIAAAEAVTEVAHVVETAVADAQQAANSAADQARMHAEAAQISAQDVGTYAASAAAAAHFVGVWAELSGPLNMPATVKHADKIWVLTEDVSDVQDYEPGVPGPWSLLGAVTAPVRRPVNVSPLHGAQISTPVPVLTIGSYHSLYGIAQGGVRFRVSERLDFATAAYDSGWLPAGASHQIPNDVLEPQTAYFWQAQMRDEEGAQSEWSLATGFETLDTREVDTPMIVSPADFSSDLKPLIVIQGSAYANSADVPQKSVRARLSVTEDMSAVIWDSGALPANTSVTVPDGVIQVETTYFADIAYESEGDIWSFPSQPVRFTTANQFAEIIGIVLTATGGGAGTWQRVDKDYNAITTNAATFANHATYAGIVGQTIDGQAMVKIPVFYVKSGQVPSGVYSGKPFWMISDVPADGFSLHPAFNKTGATPVLSQFWVGKYQGTEDGDKLGSKSGVMPLLNIDHEEVAARAIARNVSGVSGFMLWDIRQLSAIKLLCLIEMGGADSQTLIGRGNVSNAVVSTVNAAGAGWRGIIGLWGNSNQAVGGLKVDADGMIGVRRTRNSVGYSKSTQAYPYAGWIKTISQVFVDDIDLMKLFIPATTGSVESQGSFGDFCRGGASESFAYHGGGYSSNNLAGLFFLTFLGSGYSVANAGGRLAKV